MTIRERVETALVCMNNFPMTTSQFASNYTNYARLLKIWYNRYYNK